MFAGSGAEQDNQRTEEENPKPLHPKGVAGKVPEEDQLLQLQCAAAVAGFPLCQQHMTSNMTGGEAWSSFPELNTE